jgi:membrane-associated phospholipid phosphatase
MTAWHFLSSLGALNVTGPLALCIAAWLVGARSWRPALTWCVLFGAALGLAAGSQVAFIGWGVGIQSLGFTGFSGHATRAAAVFPVMLFLLFEWAGGRSQRAAALAGAMMAIGVAVARVKIGAHTPSEAVAGWMLGSAFATVFMLSARTFRDNSPQPLLIGILATVVMLPTIGAVKSHQLLTGAALILSGHDRVYLRQEWRPASRPYVPPCPGPRVRFGYVCT